MRDSVGIDVSQQTLDAAAIIGGCVVYADTVSNNQAGFKTLKAWLESLNSPDLHICMEATGVYYEEVADYLAADYPVTVVNPLKISGYAKSRFHRTKTDKQDARLIAEYGHTALKQDLPIRQTVTKTHYRLKRLLSLYNQLKVQHAAEQNRLKVAKDNFVKSIHRELIETYAKKKQAVRKEIEAVTKEEARIKKLTKRMETIPSVGKLTAAALTNYLLSGDFDNVNKFIAFAGLNPQAKQSGTSVNGRQKLTRYGNRRLRGSLFMSAMVAYREGYFSQLVANLKKRHKSPMVILVAIMKKLAVIAYTLFKKETDFDPGRYAAG